MRISDFAARAAGVLGAVALLAGCGGSAGSGSFSAIPPSISLNQTRASAGGPQEAGKNLYVANYNSNTVTVYAPGTSMPLRTIAGEAGGVQSPLASTRRRISTLRTSPISTVTLRFTRRGAPKSYERYRSRSPSPMTSFSIRPTMRMFQTRVGTA
jgi:hypothetical protein